MIWSASPCSHCPESPCCTVLPLASRRIETRKDLAEAVLLLKHRYLRLGLRDTGEWMLFYDQACRFLDRGSSKCSLFGTERRPDTCAGYSPHTCWYRGAFSGPRASKTFLLFDAGRLERLDSLLAYDAAGEIAGVPAWEEMIEACGSLPLAPFARGRGEIRFFAFKTGKPHKKEHFELFRFRLGFPGIRIGISSSGWYTIAESEGSGPAAAAGTEEVFRAAAGTEEREKVPRLFFEVPSDVEVGGLELLDRAYSAFKRGTP